MMDMLNQILDSSNTPIVTAFVLGLLTAISPCPLFTNITAVGYISKAMAHRRKVFALGVLYTLGRILAYSLLGAVLIYIIRSGEDTFSLQQAVSEIGEMLLGPILLIVGVFMLFAHKLSLPGFGFNGRTGKMKPGGYWGALLLGVLFAMSFCPTSGLFYFGMLIPMSARSGYLLPVVFAIATSLPVLIVAWVIAFGMENLSRFVGQVQVFQKWLNVIVAVIFIAVGIYYIATIFII